MKFKGTEKFRNIVTIGNTSYLVVVTDSHIYYQVQPGGVSNGEFEEFELNKN